MTVTKQEVQPWMPGDAYPHICRAKHRTFPDMRERPVRRLHAMSTLFPQNTFTENLEVIWRLFESNLKGIRYRSTRRLSMEKTRIELSAGAIYQDSQNVRQISPFNSITRYKDATRTTHKERTLTGVSSTNLRRVQLCTVEWWSKHSRWMNILHHC